jgi:hypothetical protein
MKLTYPPQEKTLLKIERIRKLREETPELTTIAIGKIIGLDQSYVSALIRWDKENHVTS